MIKEKHPSDKDKFTLKYLLLHEVAQEDLDTGDFFRDEELALKTDLIIYAYQADLKEQADSLIRVKQKVAESHLFDLIPQIALNVNLDDQRDEQLEAHRTILGQTCEKEFGLKLCKEITADNLKEILDALMATVTEPIRGLTD